MDKHHITYAEGRRNKSNRQKLPLQKQKAPLRLNLSRYGRPKVRYLNPIDIGQAERYCRFRKKASSTSITRMLTSC